jgi:hypothetical protein
MAYNESSEKIINRMKELETERATVVNTGLDKKILVPKQWVCERLLELHGTVRPPSYLNTVPRKLEWTAKKGKHLFSTMSNVAEIEFVEWDCEEYKSLLKTITDYAIDVSTKRVKANYQEYLSTMNTILIAYANKYDIGKTSIEDHLARETKTKVDYNGRQSERSSDEPRAVRGLAQGGLSQEPKRFRQTYRKPDGRFPVGTEQHTRY